MSSNRLPTVDVVVPCYNYAHYLEACVESVLNQPGVHVRVLIVDDCSPDNTSEIGQALAARDSRVTYICNPENKGLVGSANLGLIDWARADYSLLLSADDVLTPGALARAAKVMDVFPSVGMVYGLAIVFSENREITDLDSADQFDVAIVKGSAFLERCCKNWCGVASPTALVRTSRQHEVGGLDERFPAVCDMEIWMRLATVSDVAAIVAPQAYYRRHDSNMGTAFSNRPLRDLKEQYLSTHSVLESFGSQIPEAKQLLQVLDSRLLTETAWQATLAFENNNPEGERMCADFAKLISPNWWMSRAWLRHAFKKAIGRSILSATRRIADRALPAGNFSPFVVGQTFGWMPDSTVAGLHRL
jgi:glycosyltransferase involved in cell wall biosynthesis